jgi:hypothetical protein
MNFNEKDLEYDQQVLFHGSRSMSGRKTRILLKGNSIQGITLKFWFVQSATLETN